MSEKISNQNTVLNTLIGMERGESKSFGMLDKKEDGALRATKYRLQKRTNMLFEIKRT